MGNYTSKQIEAANLLRSSGNDSISPDVIDEIVDVIGELEQRSDAASSVKEDTDTIIRMKLMDERDWRKRAALSALLISKSLD